MKKKAIFFGVMVVLLFLNRGYLEAETINPIKIIPFVFIPELELEKEISDVARDPEYDDGSIYKYSKLYRLPRLDTNQIGRQKEIIIFLRRPEEKYAKIRLELLDGDFRCIQYDYFERLGCSVGLTSDEKRGPYYIRVLSKSQVPYKIIALLETHLPDSPFLDVPSCGGSYTNFIDNYYRAYGDQYYLGDYYSIHEINEDCNVFICLDKREEDDNYLQFEILYTNGGSDLIHNEMLGLYKSSSVAFESDHPKAYRSNYIMRLMRKGEKRTLRILYRETPLRTEPTKDYRKYTVHIMFLPCWIGNDFVWEWYYGGGENTFVGTRKDIVIYPNRDNLYHKYWINDKNQKYAYTALYFPQISLEAGDSIRLLNSQGDVAEVIKSGSVREWYFVKHKKNKDVGEQFKTTVVFANNSSKSWYRITHRAFGWAIQDGVITTAPSNIVETSKGDEKIDGVPPIIPKKEMLSNAPNPFNPETDIAYEVPEHGTVVLSVFNTKGKKVIELVNGFKESGSHSVHWNGKDSHGKDMPSGVYYAVLEVNGKRFTKKMIMLK